MEKVLLRLAVFIVVIVSVISSAPMHYGAARTVNTDHTNNSSIKKISDDLLETMEEHLNEKISVLVWVEDVDVSNIDNEAASLLEKKIQSYDEMFTREDLSLDDFQSYIQIKRSLSKALYEAHNERIVKECFRGEDIIYVSKYSPVILVYLSASSIIEKAMLNDIVFIDLYSPSEDETEMAIANSVTNATVAYNTYGYSGYGVKIGILENSITNTSFSGINIASQNGTVSVDTSHVDSVIAIVSSIAPDATYYIADNSVMSNFEAIEWLISKGVNVINASKPIDGDNYNNYGSVSKWLDHIAYNHDIHFVKSAGNDDITGITSGGMSYNAVTVGSINDNRTLTYADDTLSSFSSYYYNSVYAFKPDICAPGEGLNTGFKNPANGTSFAAPQVTGTIALLCQGNPTLTVRQDTVKAILTCSVNFSSPHSYVPNVSNYSLYGSGLLDVKGAVWVAENTRYIASSISSNTVSKSYTFLVSNVDDRIRVSLAFLKRSNIPGSNHSGSNPTISNLSNLDLEVYPPNSASPIATSITSNNNVEIVDFEPTVYGYYTIVVKNVSSTTTTYFGLAWR